VTKIGVVERGKLQRGEALEEQKDCGSKLFPVRQRLGVNLGDKTPKTLCL
jgi:hypothetical protein